jgi:lycopene beta-cyclase
VSVPGKLARSTRDRYEFVILGAGCSGLSLCYHLLERGVDAPILILDRKRTFEDDRTWCFWDVEPTPFTQLALKEWRS